MDALTTRFTDFLSGLRVKREQIQRAIQELWVSRDRSNVQFDEIVNKYVLPLFVGNGYYVGSIIRHGLDRKLCEGNTSAFRTSSLEITHRYWSLLMGLHIKCASIPRLMPESGEWRREWVWPDLPNLYIPFILKRALRVPSGRLRQNVVFLSVNYPETLRVSCDWCSIINGLVHTALEELQGGTIVSSIDSTTVRNIASVLYDRIRYRTTITKQDITEWIHSKLPTTLRGSVDVWSFAYLYIVLERIELRWCPFKRAVGYYRHKDTRYANLPVDPLTRRSLLEIGRILDKDHTIKCTNCPALVNQNTQYRNTNQSSIFSQYMVSLYDWE